MPRFKDVEFGFENCERHSRTPGRPGPSKKGAPALMSSASTLDAWGNSNLHASDVTKANLGKVTRISPDDRARRIAQLRADLAERRSMEPLTRADKFHIAAVICAFVSIGALFALAWMASA